MAGRVRQRLRDLSAPIPTPSSCRKPRCRSARTTTYVFVIKDDSTAEMRPVKVARTVDGISVITDGLSPGERVVTDGQLRLTNGSRVDVRSASDKPETDSRS